MLNKIAAGMVAMSLMIAQAVSAGEPADKAVEAKLRAALENPDAGLAVESVSTSELPGMYAVQFANGPVVYATESGEYFLVGDLFQVTNDGFVNLGEERRNGERETLIAGVADKDMIVFPAKGETKAHITVFTDVTCGYCRKLHREVPELNKRGIEVRYVAYPRGGVGSDGYRLLATAWCANNPGDALTRMKAGETLPDNVCPGNPVADQYNIGMKAGVTGTPAIVLENGQLIPGYQPAEQLSAMLLAE